MLTDFFEHTINKVYQNCRALVFFFISPLPTFSSYIKFGGWEMNYNWKGVTKPAREKVGNIEIITKTVHLNYKYALQLMELIPEKFIPFRILFAPLLMKLLIAFCLTMIRNIFISIILITNNINY